MSLTKSPAQGGFAKISLGGVAALALLGLFACDNGPSAVSTRDRSATLASYNPSTTPDSPPDFTDAPESAGPSRYAGRNDRRSDGVDRRSPADEARVGWASSKSHSASENADYQFKRDGAAFGASNVDQFVGAARKFVAHPPKGVETLERRNGDRLYYDAKSNTFAVATRDGTPRTFFKPRDGAQYWDQQKARANGGGRSGRNGERD